MNGGGEKTMLAVLRAAVKRRPFKPFVIHLSDGERIDIDHPESVLLVSEDLVMCADRRGVGYFFGTEHFVGVRLEGPRSAGRTDRPGGPRLVRDRVKKYRAR